MTTPVTDNTAYSTICEAMWDACLIPSGEDPDSEIIGKHLRRLNQLVLETTTAEDGPRLWLLADTSVPLVAGNNLYTFGPTGSVIMPSPKYVYDQYYQYSAPNGSTRRPVARVSRQEWDMLSTLVQQGPITQIFVDPQQTVAAPTMNVNTWLTPDANEATGTLHLVFRNLVTGFVNITDQMNFPIEWALFLHWTLASEICQGQPQSVISRCDGKAAYYKQKLIDWDQEHETSILPQPDQRMFHRRRFGK